MTTEQIYKTLSQRMLSGIMLHSDMVDYYKFLSLDGYAKFHEYRMIDESKAYRKLRKNYLHNYDKLIKDVELPRDSVIPDGWYAHVRQDVNVATLKEAIGDGLSAWIDHETETKKVYEEMSTELRSIGEIESAIYVEGLVYDVSRELAKAKKYQLIKKHIEYDIPTIMEEQKCLCEKYKDKIKECYGR